MRVLFVCSGNICRSPMAAAYFRYRAARSGPGHVVVDSAGTLGIVGSPASDEAVQAMREIGIDLSGHRSRGIADSDLRTADLVVAMERSHLEELAVRFPEGHGERLLLRAFERSPRPEPNAPDLADPIGDPLEVYRRRLERMRICLDHLALHLRHPTGGP